VAEQERLTNKERREKARDERKAKEAEAARKKKKGNLRNGVVTFAIVAVVAAVLLQAFTGGPDSIDEQIELISTQVEDARLAAGCEILAEQEPLEDRSHVEQASQLDADTVYTDTRPTHSGPHTVGIHPVIPDASNQIDEISSTHNLEHGAIIVWYDPDQVEGDTPAEIGDWAEQLNDNGFARAQAGVGILSSPYEDPGIDSGKAFAFRAWGTAMDCDEWDEDVAYGFVLDHYGTHGIGPERTIAPFPNDVLGYVDQETPDTSPEDAPLDEGFEDVDAEDVEDADSEDELLEDEDADPLEEPGDADDEDAAS
jgi:hypothetical protein